MYLYIFSVQMKYGYTKSFSFTVFRKDSKFRLRMHVSILILARWNLFACTEWRQQQLSHCLHIPFCESVLI